jgi:hypothetical protein
MAVVTAGVRVALSLGVAVGVGLGVAAAARAARDDYTGAKACGICHETIYRSWQDTAHARAASSLGKQARSRRCQSCHMTGDAPAGDAYFADVGCESCHGAGAGYSPDDVMRDAALARALGLRDLSTPAARALVCNGCHRASTRVAEFDPERAWQSIRHGDR